MMMSFHTFFLWNWRFPSISLKNSWNQHNLIYLRFSKLDTVLKSNKLTSSHRNNSVKSIMIYIQMIKLISRKFNQTFLNVKYRFHLYSHTVHSVEIAEILRKNFVKAINLIKKLLNSWFDDFFFGEREFLVFQHCAVEITEFCFHNFFAKIPSNQRLTKELNYTNWFDGKSFEWLAVNFSFFHTVLGWK